MAGFVLSPVNQQAVSLSVAKNQIANAKTPAEVQMIASKYGNLTGDYATQLKAVADSKVKAITSGSSGTPVTTQGIDIQSIMNGYSKMLTKAATLADLNSIRTSIQNDTRLSADLKKQLEPIVNQSANTISTKANAQQNTTNSNLVANAINNLNGVTSPQQLQSIWTSIQNTPGITSIYADPALKSKLESAYKTAQEKVYASIQNNTGISGGSAVGQTAGLSPEKFANYVATANSYKTQDELTAFVNRISNTPGITDEQKKQLNTIINQKWVDIGKQNFIDKNNGVVGGTEDKTGVEDKTGGTEDKTGANGGVVGGTEGKTDGDVLGNSEKKNEDPYQNQVTNLPMKFNTNTSRYSPDTDPYSRDLMSIADDYGKINLADIPALEKGNMTMLPSYERYTPDKKNELLNAYTSILEDRGRKDIDTVLGRENTMGMARSGRRTGLESQLRRDMGLNVANQQANLNKEAMTYNNDISSRTLADYLTMLGQRNQATNQDYQNKFSAQELNNKALGQQRADTLSAMNFNNLTKEGLYELASNESRYQNELKRQSLQDALKEAQQKFENEMRTSEYNRQNRGIELSNTASELAIENSRLEQENALKKDLFNAMVNIFSSALIGGQSFDMGSLDNLIGMLGKYGVKI